MATASFSLINASVANACGIYGAGDYITPATIANGIATLNYYYYGCTSNGYSFEPNPATGGIGYYDSVASIMYTTSYTYITGNSTANYYCYGYDETAEQKTAREAAKKRAREALLLILDFRQREQFEREDCFELETSTSQIYRIRPGSRVERLDPNTKKAVSLYCIHPELHHGLPAEDVAISQKLWLETDEATFLRTANETKCAA
jgi:hypothetical protein